MNQLRQQFQQTLVPQLQKQLQLNSPLAVPRLDKIVVNTSSRDFHHDKDFLEKTTNWLATITGQKPRLTRARQSIAGFNLRQGDIVGLSVTLRHDKMYAFLQKLVHIVLPRSKDFQGIKTTSFDSRGNYTLGLPEQIVFPEIEYDKIGRIQGLEVVINTTASDPVSARALLTALGLPFAKDESTS